MTDLLDARKLFDEAVLALLRADHARHRATQALITPGCPAHCDAPGVRGRARRNRRRGDR
jgi:hypothetical protein